MATILVVDDSAVDRKLIAGLLEKDSELEAFFCNNGVAALEYMEKTPPDLVVTDLRMPKMDGLELVDSVRRRFPLVPVILMTSMGSEDIAVQSLRRGASSYVPKRALAQDLLRTIHGVLEISGSRKSRNRVLQTVQHSHTVYELGNDYQLISDLVTHIEDHIKQMGICDDADCVRISVALLEGLANALYHGNLEIDSRLREENFEAYHSQARQRALQQPYKDRRIRVETDLSAEKVTVAIRDEGAGFDPTTLPDPTAPPNLERVSGRGVMLMRTLMDEVHYNSSGNEVTLVKHAADRNRVETDV